MPWICESKVMQLKNQIKEKIKDVFYVNNGYIRTKDISCAGIKRNIINIHNNEKTICDCQRDEDKISKDIIIESINEYVKRRDKNISKLMKYAAKAKLKDVVQKYIEVLI